MNKKRILIFTLIAVLAMTTVLSGCKRGKKTYDNETDAFVMSSSELDGVFNPFFYTSGPDGGVVGMTQMSMLSLDKKGGIAYGENEESVVLDYKNTVTDRPGKTSDKDFDNYFTTYEFLLKNDVQFSDGSYLTSKDVMFNFYTYLDPVYTGSITMYSTDIKGLTAYRTQSDDPDEYKQAEENFAKDGADRVLAMILWAETPGAAKSTQVTTDLKKVEELFLEELNSDWNAAAATVSDYEKDYPEIDSSWRAYMVMQGYIELKDDKTRGKYIEWGGYKDLCKDLSEEDAKKKCIDLIYNEQIKTTNEEYYKDNINFILSYRATGTTAEEYFIADEKSQYFDKIRDKNQGELKVKKISGISVDDNITQFNGKSYSDKHSLITVVINGVDPKAIFNFSVYVAPMAYYAGEAAAKYNGTTHFGVEFGSIDFMFNTVRKQDVPVGAGPYKATSENNATGMVEKTDFFKNNVVYFMRNDHFALGAPKIKYMRYKVITKTRLIDSAKLNDIHFADPDAKAQNIEQIAAISHLSSVTVDNSGYGYIGINAKYVPDINVRKAIMHAMDTSLALEYYTNDMASLIHRPMSKVSWAYPEGAEPVYKFDADGSDSWDLIKEDYSKQGGVLTNSKGEKLKYTFTIAGDTDDHPMYSTMTKAAEILNARGFDITVTKDPNALRKLASGLLSVWAAAWGAAVDPDMFQVYHMDSSATSILNWGYKEILDRGGAEKKIVEDLSKLIDDGRKTLDQDDRKGIYSRALDKVMELAVELPTYQRCNLFIYNKDFLDVTTMTPDSEISPYMSPIARIWELSLVTG